MSKFVALVSLFLLTMILSDYCFVVFRVNYNSIFAEMAGLKQDLLSNDVTGTRENIDVLFLGSSHVMFGINPSVFDSASKLKSFNIAVGGLVRTDQHYYHLKKMLKKWQPRTVVYGLESFSLNHSQGRSQLDESILYWSKVFLYRNAAWEYFKWSPILGFRLPLFRKKEIDKSPFLEFKAAKIDSTGWASGEGRARPTHLPYKNKVFNPDNKSIIFLNLINQLCRENGVRLVIVQLPEYITCRDIDRGRHNKFVDFMRHWAIKNNTIFLDYNEPDVFPLEDLSLFFDTDHLNRQGASRYSMMLARDLVSNKRNKSQRSTTNSNESRVEIFDGMLRIATQSKTNDNLLVYINKIEIQDPNGLIYKANLSSDQDAKKLLSYNWFRQWFPWTAKAYWGKIRRIEGNMYRTAIFTEEKAQLDLYIKSQTTPQTSLLLLEVYSETSKAAKFEISIFNSLTKKWHSIANKIFLKKGLNIISVPLRYDVMKGRKYTIQ